MNKVSLIILCCVITVSCTSKKQQLPEVASRDTTITIENSFTELFIDTTDFRDFMAENPMEDSLSNKMYSFYNQRNYQYAWFFPDGIAEFVPTFISLQNDFIHYSGDSSLYNPVLAATVDSLSKLKKINPNDSLVKNTELQLTRQFFQYASLAYSGDNRLNTQELNWFIPRKKLDPQVFLDSLIKNNGQNLAAYEPVNRQYNLLKERLLKYYQIDQTEPWETLESAKKLRLGSSDPVISKIKARLVTLGDLAASDSTNIFDSTLTVAVKQFQTRMGMKPSGETGPTFFAELNLPATDRIRQILINMERIRWMPAAPTTDYLLVNIPQFMLHVYENGTLAFNMNVVVGSEGNSTVIFSGTLNQVVFSPYWNVPQSILKNEILPGIKRNPNYLARHNMEWNGSSVRQKPGKSNSLGLVKFLFPNSYNIYLHDTPSKSLFGESQRAFSHGCIRLSEPKKLVEFLLRRDSTWTSEKITQAMNAGKEKYVRLRGASEIPVYIGYFTAWVDQDGLLNFRKDIYGHDKKMAERLFTRDLIAVGE
jgi:murein L,D-transpeptidase YcbB/YkuD